MDREQKPIIKLFFMKPKAAWYELSQKEQQQIMKRDTEVSTDLEKKYGGRSILVCDCFWSTEDWILFGLQEYPHLESVQEVTRALREVNFFSYFESRIILGTPGIPLEIAEPGSSEIDYQPYQRTDKPGNQLPIMKLYMMKPKASWFRLTPEQKTQIHLAEAEVTKATEKKYGFKSLIVCDCFWSTEDWAAFGVD
jgi:hypothetical protein